MTLFISILIPNIIGFIGGIIGDSFNGFEGIVKPSLSPPSIVFIVVWTILYTLMGISSFLIYKFDSNEKSDALRIYFIQLVVNALWSLFFFRFEMYLFSFFLIILLLLLVLIMINKFYEINKVAAYLQIPYVLWLIFAAILCFNVYLIN